MAWPLTTGGPCTAGVGRMQGGSDPSRWGACRLPWSDSEVASSVAQQGHSEGTQGPEAQLRVRGTSHADRALI